MAKRIGGHLVAESLAALGAEAAFGVPGIHALAIWEGLRDRGTGPGSISVYGTRTELAAGFAADGYARCSGHPAPLLLSTGPGALNSLTALMEAASAHVPVVAISSQIPSHLIGRGRGYLHELTISSPPSPPSSRTRPGRTASSRSRACSPRRGGPRSPRPAGRSTSRSRSTSSPPRPRAGR